MAGDILLRKTSLVDFPGRVAAVAFFRGCDFRCPFCHNAPLVDPARGAAEAWIDEEGLFAFLEKRRGLLSGLVLSGGEPLLKPGLPELARRARALGYAVKLDTNGSSPQRLAAVGADYVALDLKGDEAVYAFLAPPGAYAALAESLGVLRGLGAPFEIRITCAPGLVTPESLRRVLPLLGPEDHVVLQDFRPGGCLDPAWDEKPPSRPEELAALLAILREAAPRTRLRGQAG